MVLPSLWMVIWRAAYLRFLFAYCQRLRLVVSVCAVLSPHAHRQKPHL